MKLDSLLLSMPLSEQKKFLDQIMAYRTAVDREKCHKSFMAYVKKMWPAIQKEIEAYKMAMEAAEIRTPQYLRQLVIQSLVNLVIDERI